MNLQPLHSQGPSLSRIVTGVWRWQSLSSESVERLIKTSIDEGITSFDHADIYGDHSCEELFGSVLKNQ
ncbi:MAG: aldo/keto reductase, partial [Cyclobacteriaceae bacterium]